MTTFGPPPPPPAGIHQPPWDGPRAGPPPWSAAAIGSFVLALLGFIGITAVLAIVFAIIAFFTTRGGRRRGVGLAIAAVPISIVMGVVGVLIFSAVLILGQMGKIPGKLETVFSTATEPAAQIKTLRDMASQDFNESVGDDALREWFATIRAKHGSLTRTSFEPASGYAFSPGQPPRIAVKGKFVNGETTILVTFDPLDLWSGRIHDIDIDGSSPRADRPSTDSP